MVSRNCAPPKRARVETGPTGQTNTEVQGRNKPVAARTGLNRNRDFALEDKGEGDSEHAVNHLGLSILIRTETSHR